jgi:hypothetical protein
MTNLCRIAASVLTLLGAASCQEWQTLTPHPSSNQWPTGSASVNNGAFGYFFSGCPAVISQVRAGSPAEKAGVKVGDHLLRIGSRTDCGEFLTPVVAGQPIDLLVRRDGKDEILHAVPVLKRDIYPESPQEPPGLTAALSGGNVLLSMMVQVQSQPQDLKNVPLLVWIEVRSSGGAPFLLKRANVYALNDKKQQLTRPPAVPSSLEQNLLKDSTPVIAGETRSGAVPFFGDITSKIRVTLYVGESPTGNPVVGEFSLDEPLSAAITPVPRSDRSVVANDSKLRVRSVSYQSIPSTYTTNLRFGDYSSRSSCTSAGSQINCDTTYTTPTDNPVTVTKLSIYNVVESGNTRYLIGCTAAWRWSKCSSLIPNNEFEAEIQGSRMYVYATRDGKKFNKITYDILDMQPR